MDSEFLFPEDEIAGLKIGRVIKRDGRTAVFDRGKIADSIFRAAVDVGGSNRALAEALADEAIGLINRACPDGTIPGVEEIQDIIEKVLVENGHYKTAKAYILYRAEHARLREGKNARLIVEDNVPYKLLWRVFRWNVDHGCDTIAKLNAHIRNNTFPGLVADAEKAYRDEIRSVAERVLKDEGRVRLVIVAGPSSSGKTTTTMKLGEQLRQRGKRFILLNLDNYFKDLENHPGDEYGDHDFETPQALDLELINEHLSRLIQGETIRMPEYDFKTGKRRLDASEFTLEQDQILLIDSLHGLYPAMTAKIPHEMKFRFYIEALCQVRDRQGEFVRWSDLRMLRRMVRDSWHRSYNPAQTVGHWHYVRRSEKKHIVPFINKVDYVFNGALAYELPLYRGHLYRCMQSIINQYEHDPGKLDALMRARRVYGLLDEAEELKDGSCIPPDSLIREFIGGSSYKY
ncbi:MAG: uridine kinase family protein [Endomicrobiales bacterium]